MNGEQGKQNKYSESVCKSTTGRFLSKIIKIRTTSLPPVLLIDCLNIFYLETIYQQCDPSQKCANYHENLLRKQLDQFANFSVKMTHQQNCSQVTMIQHKIKQKLGWNTLSKLLF